MTTSDHSQPFSVCRPIPEDGDVDVDTYNAELAKLATTDQNTWFTAPWLFAECVVLYSVIPSVRLTPSDLILPFPSDATCASSVDPVCFDGLQERE